MEDSVIKYEIEKSNSVISRWTDGILPLVVSGLYVAMLVGLVVNRDSMERGTFVYVTVFYLLVVIVGIFWAFIRFGRWKRNLNVELNSRGIRIERPNGGLRVVGWSDVKEVLLEGSPTLDSLRKPVPVFFMDRFTFNSMVWSASHGSWWLNTRYSFLHIFFHERDYALLPVPKSELEKVINLVNKNVVHHGAEVKKVGLTRFKFHAIALIIFSFVVSGSMMVLKITEGSSFAASGGLLFIVGFVFILFSISLSWFLIMLALEGFRNQKIFIAGVAVVGKWAYVPAVLYLAFVIGIVFIASLILRVMV